MREIEVRLGQKQRENRYKIPENRAISGQELNVSGHSSSKIYLFLKILKQIASKYLNRGNLANKYIYF